MPLLDRSQGCLSGFPPGVRTDLAIDTEVGKYQFGFGVDLSGNDPPLGYKGVEMTAFGLLFTYSRPAGTK